MQLLQMILLKHNLLISYTETNPVKLERWKKKEKKNKTLTPMKILTKAQAIVQKELWSPDLAPKSHSNTKPIIE